MRSVKPSFYRNRYHCGICTRMVNKGIKRDGKIYCRAEKCRYCNTYIDWSDTK